jgi:hypothetical protein
MVKSEEGKMVPLAKGLELVLDGADISTANRAAAKSNFMEAFEDGEVTLPFSDTYSFSKFFTYYQGRRVGRRWCL